MEKNCVKAEVSVPTIGENYYVASSPTPEKIFSNRAGII